MKKTYVQITKKNMDDFGSVIIPGVLEECKGYPGDLLEQYFCIGVKADKEAAGALIAEMDQDTGDLRILSLFVKTAFQRQGIGSGLLKKLTDLAFAAYDWGPGEYGVDIFLKVMYALPEKLKIPFEAFLQKNDFTDFYVFEPTTGNKPEIRGATAQVHLMRRAFEAALTQSER